MTRYALGAAGVTVSTVVFVMTMTGQLVEKSAFAGIFLGMFLCVLAVVLHPGNTHQSG